MEYMDFLQDKIALSTRSGFAVRDDEIHPMLYPHQRDAVRWACDGGRRAVFMSFGLGKSVIQLETVRLCGEREGGRQLIICPLGVRQEFKQDAAKLGIILTFVRRDDELGGDGIYITNYESVRDGRLSVEHFNTVTLDEASVLRSYGSKTYQSFLQLFAGFKYRFVATATPSPNRYKELIHYAGFLGVMDTGEALTRFFKRDTQKANNLTLYPHMEQEFWAWLGSWALFVQKPSDLGYSDEGYELPRLHVHYHKVKAGERQARTKDGQLLFMPSAALSLQDASKEKRNSMPQRVAKMREIIDQDPDTHCIIWHDQEQERHAIKKALPEAVEVYGSQDLDLREDRIIGFSKGEFKYLATKPILSGSGCNFQRYCHKAIFLGIGFKFNDFIQAIHRIYRFLQGQECHIHIIYAETETQILKTLEQKWKAHDEMVARMTELIREHGLSNMGMIEDLKRSIGVNRQEAKGRLFVAANNDAVDETKRMEDECVDLIHTSIPFSNHYEYTPNYADFGHTKDNGHFWAQMDYLTPELYRVLRPGRIYACHVKDRILFGNTTNKGVPTVSPFHAECLFHGMQHGFDYLGMITVVTDVVRENNQTYRLGWSEQCKDGTKMGVGSPEYILLFRKPQTDRTKGYADQPVSKSKAEYSRARWQIDAHAFWRSSGDRLMSAEEMAQLNPDAMCRAFTERSLQQVYDYQEHVQIGEALEGRGVLPARFMAIAPGSWHRHVWADIQRMRTLNGEQTRRGLNNHICPLQFDIIDRIVTRYSSPGELIYDPFGGIMSVPYRAIKLGRKARAVELNHDYWLDGVQYCRMAEQEVNAPSLLDLIKDKDKEAVNA